LTVTGTDQIVGYVSLTTGQIEWAVLPKAHQRNLPDPLPILPLGQLAIDKRHQGRGYGVDLLHHALRVAIQATESIAFAGIVTHPLGAPARAFCLRHDFQELPGDPKGALMLRTKDLLKGAM
jgi:GNAT superfamily N-acetyltransferase